MSKLDNIVLESLENLVEIIKDLRQKVAKLENRVALDSEEAAETITLEEFYEDCSRYQNDIREMGEYLMTVYPNGLRIVIDYDNNRI